MKNEDDKMGTAFSEYEIYVPTVDNSGNKYPTSLIAAFKDRIVEECGGMTDTNHPNKGVWRIGPYEMRDDVIVWRVLAEDASKTRFISELKLEMEKKLQQKTVLVVMRKVVVL